MTVQELIKELQRHPSHYRVLDFEGDEIMTCEIENQTRDIIGQSDNMDVFEETEEVVVLG
jgi:hypothetical protein